MNSISKILTLGALLLSTQSNAAIIINTHTFSAVTNGAISTTGLADWGFVDTAGGFFDSNLGGGGLSYNNTDFGSIANNGGTVLTSVEGSPSIGSVTLTEGTTGTDTISPQGNAPNYTFDGTAAHGSYGNFAPNEADIWRLTFNNLGVGDHTIKLYMGHSATNRIFNMDVSFDGGTSTFVTTTSPQIGTLGSTVAAYGATGLAFTYDIDVTVSDPSDDLTLTFGGVSGSFGGAIFSGYTVSSVPEPSSILLFSLAGLGFFAHRRRTSS